jgi:hypothetical protein
MQQLRVSGQSYEWVVRVTSEFSQLRRLGDPENLEVLQIRSVDKAFGIAVRVFVWPHDEGVRRHLGPALVLSTGISSVQAGIMIELRPKVCRVPELGLNSASVERVIQWFKSAHFRVRRVNSSGGRWVGYSYAADT